MQVVLDSNVLLVSIPRSSVYRPIFNALLQKRFGLVISTEILSEYEELIEQKANGIVAANIAEMLINLEMYTSRKYTSNGTLLRKIRMTISLPM